MGAVLTGVSIACIAAGVMLLVVQVRHRPADAVPPPSGNGSAPPERAAPKAAPPAGARAAASRGEAARRRRILSVLLLAMVASLAVALVVQERWVWGVHLFVDDAFLGYVAWLARRAETRARVPGALSTPELEGAEGPEEADAAAEAAEAVEEEAAAAVAEAEVGVTDARA